MTRMALRFLPSRWLLAASVALAPDHRRTRPDGDPATDRRAGAKPVTVERIKVHSAAIEGNLEGNSADRDVVVVLPPDYARTARAAIRWSMRCTAIRSGRTSGRRKSMSLPRSRGPSHAASADDPRLPDSKTMHNGSMYSSSQTVGDFERFISHDLIAAIDARYRTIPRREARGLAGHSWVAMALRASG